MRFHVPVALLLVTPALAQAPLGTLKTEGASIAGLVAVADGRATLGNSGAVTAGAATAEVLLQRGGTVKVCAGSTVHLSQGNFAVKRPPLLLALDRGATEIHLKAEKNDSVLTPDLRFELSDAAPLDLRVRVVSNGDTCVENAGRDAPILHVTATFGDGAYLIRPGQRVLFEHGSLQEVVDHESSSCGCPPASGLVVAAKGARGKAADPHPFPEAVSQGLAATEVPQAAPGETHTQVAATLRYDGATNTASGPPETAVTAGSEAAANAAAVRTAPVQTEVVSAAPPPAGPNPFRAVGRFFKRLFGGS